MKNNIHTMDRAWWRAVLENKQIKSVIFTNPAAQGMLTPERIKGFELENGVVVHINEDGKFQTQEAGPFAYGSGGE